MFEHMLFGVLVSLGRYKSRMRGPSAVFGGISFL